MTFTVTKSGGNTTDTWSITGVSTKIDPINESWAKYCWHNGFGLLNAQGDLVDYATATNNQKLAAINKRIKQLGLDEANKQEDTDAKAALVVTKHNLVGVNGG